MTTCLVNLAYLDPARIGGVGRIAHEVGQLLADCAESSDNLRVIYVVNWRFAGAFADWLGRPTIVVPFITRRDLRLTLQRLNPDVIVSPLFGLEPFEQAKAIHIAGMPDALALDHPQLFSAADLAYRHQVYDHLQQATTVVTLSDHARQQIRHHTSLHPDQITVVPLGAEPQTPGQSVSLPDLPARYIFYPANVWPHKRHDLLFQTMKRLWARQPDLHLVMTGGRSDADRQSLQMLMTKYDCPPERIHDWGYVSDAQLMLLYRKAEALVFVSQYEGFGMPLLEAMQQGCPVICAPLASIPEVVGEAAIYVNSEDSNEWANAILTQLPQQRDQLIAAGYERAAQFTWAKTRAGWQAVLASAGVVCQDQSTSSTHQTADLARRIQPLLTEISRLAASMGRSRAKQIAGLPKVIWLQIRILALAQHW